MTEEKLITLAEKLEAKTVAGTMFWEQTALDDQYQTNLSTVVIQIASLNTEDGGVDYKLILIDHAGNVVEVMYDEDLTNMYKRVGKASKNGFYLLQSIYKNAKRSALGVDKTLDKVLTELDDVGDAPPPA